MNRLIGLEDSEKKGPLIILIGALHGNEDTGVHAIVDVMRSFEEWKFDFKGKLVGLLGNCNSYEKGTRFIDYDLNRAWTEEYVDSLLDSSRPPEMAEDFELLDLNDTICKFSEGDFSMKIIVDLHATSSDNGNFVVIPKDESDHPTVRSLRLPVIIDLEQYLEGTLLEYYHKRGFVSFAFEGGMIGSDKAMELHTSGIWEILYASGMLERRHDHEFSKYDELLESFIHEIPHKVSVLYRHRIRREDTFKMKPGYYNFKPVKKGEVVATDKSGEIEILADGMIFMPLYQDLGDDGFFVVKEIEGRL